MNTTTSTNHIDGFPNLVTEHPVLHTSHYAIFHKGAPVVCDNFGTKLTADPALWLYRFDRRPLNGTAKFRIDECGVKHYRGYSFVPVVHPAALASFNAGGGQ